jgi:mono/diheme cytochrome c family protein
MRRALVLAGAAGLSLLGVASSFADSGDASYEKVARGQYLATVGDCAACHTAPGGKPFAGGVPIETPFGRLVGANITPDRNTGIGGWSVDDFQNAMSQGIAKGGYHLYGAMPFTAYTKVTKEDNAAIWAYLQTVEPVNNPIEPNQLPFPFNVRLSLYGWNFLNFAAGEYVPDGTKTAEWNRGAYIVQGLGHCGTCHTPKSLTGGDKNGEFLQGTVVDGWLAPNITADPHKGIGSWSVEDLTQYLKTGANQFDVASGPMAEEVHNSSQYWNDADLQAVAVYLKDLGDKNAPAPAPIAASDPVMVAGKEIYADRCSGCHVGKGEGVPSLFPRLANTPLVNNDDATSLIRVILAGSQAGSTAVHPTTPSMPSFGWNLDDAAVASVVTYVRNSWGNAAPAVTAADVGKLRASLQE